MADKKISQLSDGSAAQSGDQLAVTRSGTNFRVTAGAIAALSAPGGTDAQVQFNDGGGFGGDAGLTYNKTTNVLTNTDGQLVLTGGTVTASTPVISVTQTWNNGSLNFNAFDINVTDTASSFHPTLFTFRVGGTTRLALRKDGRLFSGAVSDGNASMLFSGKWTLFGNMANTETAVALNATNQQSAIRFQNTGSLGWSSTGDAFTGSADLLLVRDAADTFAQRRTTNAQTFRIYNTFTDTSNYERLSFGFSSNNAVIEHEYAGTGAARNLVFRAGGADRLTVQSNGNVNVNGWVFNSTAGQISFPGNWNFGIVYGSGSGLWHDAVGNVYFTLSNSRLGIGGATSSFPALKRSGTGLQVRLADDSAFTGLTAAGLTLDGGTVTTSTPVISATQTWNNAAVTFEGIVFNATNTASANGSTLLALQVGGVDRVRFTRSTFTFTFDSSVAVRGFNIRSTGGGNHWEIGAAIQSSDMNTIISNGTGTNPLINLGQGNYHYTAGDIRTANNFVLTPGGITNNAAATLEQRNGTNAQTFRIYNTFTDTANYERLSLGWTSSVFRMVSEAAGTGTIRKITIVSPTLEWRSTTGNDPADISFSRISTNAVITFARAGVNALDSISGGNGVMAISAYTRMEISGGSQGVCLGATIFGQVGQGSGASTDTVFSAEFNSAGAARNGLRLLLQGGNATNVNNYSGGDLLLDGGNFTGTGLPGRVVLGSRQYRIFAIGGTSELFPALKHSGHMLQLRLADDSGFTGLSASRVVYNGAISGAVTVKPADTSDTYTLTLPANDGDAGQVLVTDGSGTTSWATRVQSDPTGVTGADAIANIVSLTQAEYDAIAVPSATTLYVITG